MSCCLYYTHVQRGERAGHTDEKWMSSFKSTVVKHRCLDTDAAGHSRAYGWLGHKSYFPFRDGLGGLAFWLFLRQRISLHVDKEEGLS